MEPVSAREGGTEYDLGCIAEQISKRIIARQLYSDYQMMSVPNQYAAVYKVKAMNSGIYVNLTTMEAAIDYIFNAINALTEKDVTAFLYKRFRHTNPFVPDMNRVAMLGNVVYIPIMEKKSEALLVSRGCLRMEIYIDRYAITHESDILHGLSSQGIGEVIQTLTYDCIPVKKSNVSGTPCIEVEGYSEEVDGVTRNKLVLLSDSIGITRFDNLYQVCIPRTVVKPSEFRYIGSVSSFINILKSLKCFTREDAIVKVGEICPITYPIVPVVLEVLRNGTDAEFNTSNSATIHRQFLKIVAPALEYVKARMHKDVGLGDFNHEYLPAGITKKDTKVFIQEFIKTKYQGVPVEVLIASKSDEVIKEASEKYFEVFLRNGEESKAGPKGRDLVSKVKSVNLGELLKAKMTHSAKNFAEYYYTTAATGISSSFGPTVTVHQDSIVRFPTA